MSICFLLFQARPRNQVAFAVVIYYVVQKTESRDTHRGKGYLALFPRLKRLEEDRVDSRRLERFAALDDLIEVSAFRATSVAAGDYYEVGVYLVACVYGSLVLANCLINGDEPSPSHAA